MFLLNDFKNEIKTEESIRESIVSLTGWKPRVISNAMIKLLDNGELERVNQHVVRLNPDVANRYGATFASKYEGKNPNYNEKQQKLIDALEKIIHTRDFPAEQEYEQLLETELIKVDEEMLNAKIERLEQTVENLSDKMDQMQRTIIDAIGELKKHDTDAAEKLERRHLRLVTDGQE